MDGYEVKVYYSEEDGCYVAQIVEFIGCAADGDDCKADAGQHGGSSSARLYSDGQIERAQLISDHF